MAKKAAVVKKPEVPSPSDKTKNLVEAIVTVRNLQDFIKDRGGLEAALGTVTRVGDLVALTGVCGTQGGPGNRRPRGFRRRSRRVNNPAMRRTEFVPIAQNGINSVLDAGTCHS